MATTPLSERRKKLAELCDKDGKPIDQRQLAKSRFLTDPVSNAETVTKALMAGSKPEGRRAYLRERNRDLASSLRKILSRQELQKVAKQSDHQKLKRSCDILDRVLDLMERGPKSAEEVEALRQELRHNK